MILCAWVNDIKRPGSGGVYIIQDKADDGSWSQWEYAVWCGEYGGSVMKKQTQSFRLPKWLIVA